MSKNKEIENINDSVKTDSSVPKFAIGRDVICKHQEYCDDLSEEKCLHCINNTIRHRPGSFYEYANDNPVPEDNPEVKFEYDEYTTLGYKCPVCNKYNDINDFVISTGLCKYCGYLMNIKRYRVLDQYKN